MKIAVLCALILSASTAGAETQEVATPTEFYLESPVAVKATLEEVQQIDTRAEQKALRKALRGRSKPFTNLVPVPATTEERKTSLLAEIDKLQRERDALLSAYADPSSATAIDSQREADAKLRKINKIQSELLKLPAE